MKKLVVLLLISVITFALVGCGYSSNEPCFYCNDTPTKQVSGSGDEAYYYCEECVTECFLCSEKATQHYTNYIGSEVFVCDDCYY